MIDSTVHLNYMKFKLLFALLCLSTIANAQAQLGYIKNQADTVEHLFLRSVIKDTTINKLEFKKILLEKFTSLTGPHSKEYQFEHRGNKRYVLYDRNLKTIHDFALTPGVKNAGILFGRQDTILSDYPDAFGNYGRSNYYRTRVNPFAGFTRFYINDSLQFYFKRDKYNYTGSIEITGNTNKIIEITQHDFNVKALNQSIGTPYDLSIQTGDELHYKLDLSALGEFLKYMPGFDDDIMQIYKVEKDTIINGVKRYNISRKGQNNRFLGPNDNRDDNYWVVQSDSGWVAEDKFHIKNGPFKANIGIGNNKPYATVVEKEVDINDMVIKFFTNSIDSSAFGKFNELYAKNSSLFYTAESIVYDTIGGKTFATIKKVSNTNGTEKTANFPLYFPADIDMSDFNMLSTEKPLLKVVYLKKNGVEYGTNYTTKPLHPVLKKHIEKQSIVNDSLTIINAMIDSIAAVQYMSNWRNELMGTVNVLSPKKVQVAVYCKQATNLYIDLYDMAGQYDFDSQVLGNTNKTYKAKQGWNVFELKGFDLQKFHSYRLILYSGDDVQNLSVGESRTFVYLENEVIMDEPEPAYNYSDDYDY
jgi:hypothetical protein